MSVFPRIDPDHPLTVAAREVNDSATKIGVAGVIEELGMNVGLGEFAYLAEQRGLRALAAQDGIDLQPGTLVTAAWMANWNEGGVSAEQQAVLTLLTSAYMDGMAIGFAAASRR